MNNKKDNPVYNTSLLEISKHFDNKEPIRKGCNNDQCFCTGACQEIIGWKDKNPLPFNRFPNSEFPNEEESHFEDIEETKTCCHIEHNPPTHLYIPHGKRYIHICPECKERTVFQPPQITF
jgi:hypothetical protein